MLIKKFHEDSLNIEGKVFDVIPEKKKSGIKIKKEEFFLKKINYNSNEINQRNRSNSSNKRKYNLLIIKNKFNEKIDSKNKDLISIQPIKLRINNFNLNLEKHFRLNNLDFNANKIKPTSNSKSPLKSKLKIEKSNKTLALPVISIKKLNLSINIQQEEIRISQNNLPKEPDFSKSNFFSFMNLQKEKQIRHQKLKSVKKSFREKKYHVFNKNEKIFYYVILPGNASHLMKQCMDHRVNWKECQSSVTTLFNFKWQQNTVGIDFPSLSKLLSIKQIVSHFEFHHQISNKFNLFINMTKYCEQNNLEVFNYLPFTVIIQYDNDNYTGQMNNFTLLYNNLKDYLMDYSSIGNKNRKNTNNSLSPSTNGKKKKYRSFFNFNGMGSEKLGNNSTIFIPTTHYVSKNLWLVKAANLNRGRCIKIADSLQNIQKLIKQFYDGINKKIENEDDINSNTNLNTITNINTCSNKQKLPTGNFSEEEDKEIKKQILPNLSEKYRANCVLIQKYIENPLLYNGRKFDVRIWVLITHKSEVYAFKEGHLKTSSTPYDVHNTNSQIHLTNYSVQKHCDNFSKYEEGNEVPFDDFQNFLDKQYGKNFINVKTEIFKKIKDIIEITCKAVQNKIDMNSRTHSFEIFGYDFIIDANFNIFLLEVNTNPGLEESSSWIKVIVPRMLDDALRLTIDDAFDTKFNFINDEIVDKNSLYISPYPVEGYTESENLWDFVCEMNKNSKEKKLTMIIKKSKKGKKRKE